MRLDDFRLTWWWRSQVTRVAKRFGFVPEPKKIQPLTTSESAFYIKRREQFYQLIGQFTDEIYLHPEDHANMVAGIAGVFNPHKDICTMLGMTVYFSKEEPKGQPGLWCRAFMGNRPRRISIIVSGEP
jgi:hypothetical protein